MKKKIVYIAHAIGGDVKNNIDKVLNIIKGLNTSHPDIVPFAPYIVDCMAMDDSIPEERSRGIENNTALFHSGFINEVWLYGNRVSDGMKAEIELAGWLGIPVKSMSASIVDLELTTIPTTSYNSIKTKADKWDKLNHDMGNLYEKLDDSGDQGGLNQVGELAASHLGYLR